MPRLLLRVSLAGVLVLYLALMTMRIAGAYRPQQVVMSGLDTACEGKPQPCWFGVVLGQTTIKDVQTLFSQFGDRFENNTIKGQIEIFKTTQGSCFAQFVYGRSGSTIINEIILTNCARVRLGDLLARYGEPETIGTSITCDRNHPVIQPNNYYIEYPEAGIIANINRPAMLRPWLSLQGNVRQLYLVKPRQTDGRKTWAGLVSFERFARLHPEQIRNNSCGP